MIIHLPVRNTARTLAAGTTVVAMAEEITVAAIQAAGIIVVAMQEEEIIVTTITGILKKDIDTSGLWMITYFHKNPGSVKQHQGFFIYVCRTLKQHKRKPLLQLNHL